MRSRRRVVRISLVLFFLPIFVVTQLLFGVPRASAQATGGIPPLPVPEDPLGSRTEPAPEISIGVDVRDGHLILRVVDIWGPGRVPLVMRTFTRTPTSPAWQYWQFNHHLSVQAPDSPSAPPTMYALRADGTQDTYRLYQQDPTYPNPTWYYRKDDRGTWSQLNVSASCTMPVDTWVCTPTTSIEYLPKGVIRRYSSSRVRDTSGNFYSYGPITQEQDANGNVVTYGWTSLPNQDRPYIASVTDPVGRVTTYGYYAARNVCFTNPDGCFTFYRVQTATAPNPYGAATYNYSNDTLVSVGNAAGFTTQYGYSADGGGPIGTVTDARGFSTAIGWARGYLVSRVTLPGGASTVYGYTLDGSGNVTGATVTDPRNNTTSYAITTTGDITSITDPIGNVTTFAYDTHHNVTQVTDARGTVTTATYNPHNKPAVIVRASGSLNLTTSMNWDASDNLLTLTPPRGNSTNYTYDSRNNLTSVRRAVGTADEALTQYTYTSWGGVASMVDPRGNTTTYTYTARRQIQTVTPPAGGTTTYGYDGTDNQVSMTDGNGHTWTTIYNQSRLPTTSTDPLGNQVVNAYDPNGNRTSVTDPKNQVTTFTYDSRNRVTAIADPLTGTTSYGYDAVSNLTRVTNARNFAILFAYDAANRLTQTTDMLGQVTTYGYDQVDNRTSLRDRKGVTATSTYDPANRPTQVSAGGITFSYTYDANGNRLTLTDPTGTYTATYDGLDRRTSFTYPDGKNVSVAYDRAGNRTALVYPGGSPYLIYAYDPANRLTQVTQGSRSWTFAYDGSGNRTQLTQPNGTSTAYSYANNNWLASITHQNASGPFLGISYAYDANGNRISQADSSGTTTFTYDALNRLMQAAYPGTYGTWSWTYDPAGNRTSQTAPSGQTTYTYDGNNRLTQAGATTYTYDANGNPTGTSAGQTFTYDPFNRMTQASGPGGTATYTYNGDGRKVQRVGPDGTTRYYYDGIRPIWETNASGAVTAQMDRDIFGNLLSRLDGSGTPVYYHTDGLGSTIALTDAGGNIAGAMLYDAWGNVRASGSDVGKYRFTGAELDAATGLYHMGARFYDPTIGRWLSEDPVQGTAPASLNFYAYVANHPLTSVDPTGLHGGLYEIGSWETLEGSAWEKAMSAVFGGGAAFAEWVHAMGGANPLTPYAGQIDWGPLTASYQHPVLLDPGCSGCGTHHSTDFYSFTANVLTVGPTVVVNVAKNGHVYVGGGLQVGKGLTTVSFSATGNLIDEPNHIQGFLTGVSVSWGAGLGLGWQYGATGSNSSRGAGLVSPQIGAGVTFSIDIGKLFGGW